jgi:hypothetical protein
VIFTFLIELKGNLYETSFKEVGILFLLVVAVVLCVQTFFYFVLRDKYKTSLISTLFTFMFLSFGILFPYHTTMKFIQQYPIFGFNLGSYKYIFPLYWGVFVLLTLSIYRYVSSRSIAIFLSRSLLFLVALNGLFLMPNIYDYIIQKNEMKSDEVKKTENITLTYGYKPDIYYILLDGYPRADTLQSFFNFDNSSFLKTLEKKNFFVGDKSCSNYAGTALSLPSIFDMKYLNTTYVNFKNFFQEGFVFKFLKNNDYRLINVSGNFGFTTASKVFHENRGNFLLKSFSEYFLNRTAIFPFMAYIYFFNKGAKIKLQFSELKKVVSKQKSPQFIFCHIMLPHLSFAFDSKGNSLIKNLKPDSLRLLYDKGDRKGLGNQIEILNSLVIDVVNTIQKKSKRAPIIIIQSDHGTFWLDRSDRNKKFPFDASRMIIKERMSNLNALFLPGSQNVKLSKVMSNVNTFRLIFNHYFGMQFPLLKDECYWQGDIRYAREEPYSIDEINSIPLPSLEEQKHWLL